MDDDLNTSAALASIFEMIREVNAAVDQEQVLRQNRAEILDALATFDSVLGVIGDKQSMILGSEIAELIQERQQARRLRSFARADQIRDSLLDQGIILEDTKDGTSWRRK
jgi:cysteinyl-tRNA synthetase